MKTCNFIKKRLQYSCFLVNIAKFLKTIILKNICQRLLLMCFIPNLYLHKTFVTLIQKTGSWGICMEKIKFSNKNNTRSTKSTLSYIWTWIWPNILDNKMLIFYSGSQGTQKINKQRILGLFKSWFSTHVTTLHNSKWFHDQR